MKTFKRTTLSLAAAQAVMVWTGSALAQTTTAPPAKDDNVIIVKGQRAALISSQKLKQDAEEIVDSVVAEDMGKLPDRSVSEVLQRVVGISMDRVMVRNDPTRYSPEGSGILIRGLPFVSSNFNGRESFSANSGRMLGFEDVPPELMARVDVYKNPAAEHIEGAIAGLVDLRTAMPFDFKGFKASVTAKINHSPLRDNTKPDFSGLVSNTWETDLGRFGALLDLAHSKSSLRTDSITLDPFYPETTKGSDGLFRATGRWFPKSMGWKSLEYDRTRDGLYGALQWSKDDLKSSLTFFRSKYKNYTAEYNVQSSYNPYGMALTNAVFDGNGVLTSGTLSNADSPSTGIPMNANTRFMDRTSKTDELGWNIVWSPNDRWVFTGDVQWVKSKTTAFDSTVATGINMPSQTWDLTGDLPSLVFTDSERARMADPANYYWAFTMEHLDRGTGEQKAVKADARYRFNDPVLSDLRFGVRFTDRDAVTQNSNPFYHWAAVTQTWQAGADSWQPLGSLAYLSRFPGGTATRSFNNFMGGKSSVTPLVMPTMETAAGFPDSYATLHGYAKQLCEEKHGAGADICNQSWTGIPWQAATFDPNDISSINKQKERTSAFYTQLRFGFDDWAMPVDGNVGLRVVRTSNSATGATVLTAMPAPQNATSNIGTLPVFTSATSPIVAENSYTNVLPSLNLRMKANEQLQFRLAASQAISRPAFSDMQAYTTMTSDFTSKEVTTGGTTTTVVDGLKLTGTANGNPLLKPVRANQVDLTSEWYFGKSNSFTVAAFNKQLKDMIVNQTLVKSVTASDGTAYNFNVTGQVNGAKGWARGMEVAFQRYFDKLPGAFAGFGMQANYTRVNSKQERYNAVYTAYCTTGAGADNLNLNINGCDTDGRSFSGLPMLNISKHSANLALLYDHGPLSARVAYNWRSKYLMAVAANSDNTGPNQVDALDTNPASANFGKHNLPLGLPLWGDNYGQVDVTLHYKLLGDKLTLGFEAQNVTDSQFKVLMQQNIGMQGHLWQSAGPRYSLSMNYSF